MAQTVCVIVSAVDRDRLEAIVADRNQRQKDVERARIVLASADRGLSAQQGAQSIGVSRLPKNRIRRFISRSWPIWRRGGTITKPLPPGKVAAWREAIGRVGADGALLRRLGGAGRSRAETEFTWAANAEKLEAIFAEGASCAAS